MPMSCYSNANAGFFASAQVITVPQSKELIAATKNKGIKGDDDQADEDDDDDD